MSCCCYWLLVDWMTKLDLGVGYFCFCHVLEVVVVAMLVVVALIHRLVESRRALALVAMLSCFC